LITGREVSFENSKKDDEASDDIVVCDEF